MPVYAGSVAVTNLFDVLGVPVVPARASFSPCVGILVSLSPTAIGRDALAGATESLVRPLREVVAAADGCKASKATISASAVMRSLLMLVKLVLIAVRELGHS